MPQERHWLPVKIVDLDGGLTGEFKQELELKNRILQGKGVPDDVSADQANQKIPSEIWGHEADPSPQARLGPGSAGLIPHANGTNHSNAHYRGEDVPDDIFAMKKPNFLSNYKNPCWFEDSSLRCLPYFHILGVDKCGTTDLWYRLTQHPDIVRPRAVMGKETHWWSWRRFGFDIWQKKGKIRHFDWYLRHFDEPAMKIKQHVVRQDNKTFHPLITGEGSPTVFWDFTGWEKMVQNQGREPDTAVLTPHSIQHLTPNAKFIVIVRNPTERLYSDYLFLDRFKKNHNISVSNFHKDVIASIRMLGGCLEKYSQASCLFDKELHISIPVRLMVGMYDVFLSEWLKVFPAQQLLVIRNEDYSKDIKTYLKAVFIFLQLKSLSDPELDRIASLPRVFEKPYSAKALGPMLNGTKKLLDDFYFKYNKMLADRFLNNKYLWISSPGIST